jgi:hypothetical protein
LVKEGLKLEAELREEARSEKPKIDTKSAHSYLSTPFLLREMFTRHGERGYS